jgi:dienelactone hydrolase
MLDEAHQLWQSSAHFHADRQGAVDLARQASEGGSYSGLDHMGLFWSLLPAHDPKPEATRVYATTTAPWAVRLSALVGGKQVASQTAKRELVDPRVRRSQLQQGGLVGILYSPPDSDRHPGVLVMGGSEGGVGVSAGLAALFASHGLVALALAYFKAPGLPPQLADIPLEYFTRARDWLDSQPDVKPGRVAVVGLSRGGELALLLAATFPDRFQSVVAYVPSAEIYPGYGAQTPIPPAAWTLNGKPLPWLPVPVNQVIARDGLLDDRPAFESSLANQPAAAAAVIPVEKIAGPLLLISGTDDQAWPSDRYADLIELRRKTANVPYADQSLKYEGAGHLISQPYLPTNLNQLPGVAMGGTPRAYASADADSWPRVLRFLGAN